MTRAHPYAAHSTADTTLDAPARARFASAGDSSAAAVLAALTAEPGGAAVTVIRCATAASARAVIATWAFAVLARQAHRATAHETGRGQPMPIVSP
jgi:hypothetical protein